MQYIAIKKYDVCIIHFLFDLIPFVPIHVISNITIAVTSIFSAPIEFRIYIINNIKLEL